MPFREALHLAVWHFEDSILAVFCHVLVSSYFSFGEQFCEHTDGLAVGLLLSPVIVDLYIDYFKEKALAQVAHKCLCWFCHLVDTFIVWSRRPERLERFLDHLNGVHLYRGEERNPLPVMFPCEFFASLFLCCLQVPGWTTVFWAISFLCFLYILIWISLLFLGIFTRLQKMTLTPSHGADLWLPLVQGISWLTEELLVSEERLCSMELVSQ
jgi:hypothetical protein